MSDLIEIRLDGEPCGKGRPRFSRASGTAYTPEKTRTYEGMLRTKAMDAMRGRRPIDGPFRVTIEARFSIPASWPKWKKAAAHTGQWRHVSKPDGDNLLKVLDALNHVVFVDDSQATRSEILKRYHEQPALLIWIEPLSQAGAAA